jgi:hypothetical protein
VTKSGTNDFRGEIFFFDRDNRFGARNPSALLPTANGLIAVKPKGHSLPFGGAVASRYPLKLWRSGRHLFPVKTGFLFLKLRSAKRNFPGVATPQIRYCVQPDNGCRTNRACPANGTTGLTAGQQFSVAEFRKLERTRLLLSSAPSLERHREDRIKRFSSEIDWIINNSNT